MPSDLRQRFGNIDIYLFDQLLKGAYDNCRTVLDAGCGGGRNLVYLLQNGFDVYGIDPSAEALATVRELAKKLSPNSSPDNFKVASAEDLPFEDGFFDLVICNAVLHFANNADHFDGMVRSMWRVLKPGGYFFARLASDIGIETLVEPVGNGRYHLPDGSDRFLVNERFLLDCTKTLGGQLHEPIKTTNVQNMRAMTTWCLRKAPAAGSSATLRRFKRPHSAGSSATLRRFKRRAPPVQASTLEPKSRMSVHAHGTNKLFSMGFPD